MEIVQNRYKASRGEKTENYFTGVQRWAISYLVFSRLIYKITLNPSKNKAYPELRTGVKGCGLSLDWSLAPNSLHGLPASLADGNQLKN